MYPVRDGIFSRRSKDIVSRLAELFCVGLVLEACSTTAMITPADAPDLAIAVPEIDTSSAAIRGFDRAGALQMLELSTQLENLAGKPISPD